MEQKKFINILDLENYMDFKKQIINYSIPIYHY